MALDVHWLKDSGEANFWGVYFDYFPKENVKCPPVF